MKIAIIIYDAFCMFELSAALENFALQAIPIKIFGEEKKAYRSEEGMLCVAEYSLDELDVEEFDAILLTGFSREKFPLADVKLLQEKLQEFDHKKKVIAAISAGPFMLIKAGIVKNRPFMCGCPREGLLEENITIEDMPLMKDAYECMEDASLVCIRSDHILTSVAWNYREWAMEIASMLGIEQFRGTFGLPKES